MSLEELRKSYTWSLQFVKDLCEEKLSFRSPEFPTSVSSSDSSDIHFNVSWRLMIALEPGLIEKTECQYISLFLRKVNKTVFRLPILKVTFSIMDPVEGKKFSKYKILLNVVERQHYGFSDFISIYEFEKLNLSSLTIHVEIEEIKKDFFRYAPLLKNTISSDVELRIGDKIYPGHKVILAMSSRFFQEKFGSQESVSYFQVEDTELEVFEELLKYIYTGKVHNLEEQAFVLFQAASKYEIFYLISECVDVLIKNLKLENVFSILSACERDSKNPKIEKLIRECIVFIGNNFERVMHLDLCAGLIKTEPRYLVDILTNVCTSDVLPCKNILDSVDIREKFLSVKSDVPVSCHCQMHYDKYLNSETMKDVDIYVDEKKYFAHRLVLAARSAVFEKMFAHPMKESLSGVIHIDDIEPEVFYEVLRFMYTNKVDESKNMVQKILVAANKYEINDLKLLCECILEQKLETESAIDIIYLMTFADDHNADKLKEKCLDYVLGKVCFNEKMVQYEVHFESIAESHAHLVFELMKKLVLIIPRTPYLQHELPRKSVWGKRKKNHNSTKHFPEEYDDNPYYFLNEREELGPGYF